jgi:hypothetical protein
MKPMFVKIEDYNDVNSIVKLVKNKIADAKIVLDELDKIKAEEQEQLGKWKTELGTVEEKVSFISKTFSGSE